MRIELDTADPAIKLIQSPGVVGTSGTRENLPVKQQHAFYDLVLNLIRKGATAVHHGACTGADAFMHGQMVNLPGVWIHVHPPVDRKYEARNLLRGPRVVWHDPLPYGERNQAIADACDVLVAAPQYPEDDPRSKRSGTWQTCRKAKAAGKLVLIADPGPDGKQWTYFDPNDNG